MYANSISLAKIRLPVVAAIYGPIVSAETYSVGDVEYPVLWLDGRFNFRGKTTIFNTILLNQTALDRCSDAMTDRVFLHELGHVRHQQRNKIRVVLSLCLRVLLLAGMLYCSAAAIALALLDGWKAALPIMVCIGAICLSAVLFARIWRSVEKEAEMFCLKHLGNETFAKYASEEGRSSYVRRLFYPSAESVMESL